MTTSNSITYADLAAQVAMLSRKMEDVLGWIRSQVNPIAKDDGNKCVTVKEKGSSSSNIQTGKLKTHYNE